MKLKILFYVGLILIFHAPAYAEQPAWLKKMKQIDLMTDSYDDVVDLLGKPDDETTEKELIEVFDFDEGEMSVRFAPGECLPSSFDRSRLSGWKVPKWTVTNVSFSLDNPIDKKKLGVDFTGFRKYPVHDVRNEFIYENDELGIRYRTKGQSKILDISFYPANKFDLLNCNPD